MCVTAERPNAPITDMYHCPIWHCCKSYRCSAGADKFRRHDAHDGGISIRGRQEHIG
jgi:hypothetical protein